MSGPPTELPIHPIVFDLFVLMLPSLLKELPGAAAGQRIPAGGRATLRLSVPRTTSECGEIDIPPPKKTHTKNGFTWFDFR